MTQTNEAQQVVYTSLERGAEESYEAYRVRRKDANKIVKALKRGKEFWDSGYAGTYVNKERLAKKGSRKAAREAKRASV